MSNPNPTPKQRTAAEVRTGQAAPIPISFAGVAIQTLAVDVPWAASSGYAPRFLESRMTIRQGAALRNIHRAMLESGMKVRSPTAAAVELLNRAADAMGLSPTGEMPGRQKS